MDRFGRAKVFAFELMLLPGISVSAWGLPAGLSCTELKAQMESNRIPDLAIAVFQGGQVESAYCGSGGNPLSPGSVFEAASLGKPIFAAGVLKLVQDHRLDLDVPLSKYLKEAYRHQQNPFGDNSNTATDIVLDSRLAKVTARMVLSHTSGLPNWSRSGPLTFLSNPGARWSYSAEGYVYLQKVVESITGQPIEAFLEHTVLLPLGMTHSSFVWRESLAGAILAGHSASGVVEPAAHYRKAVVSSTLYTTLGDYSRFVSKLLGSHPDSQFSTEENVEVPVRPDLHLAWGLGLAIEQISPVAYFHWGANPGFQSFFLCQPTTGKAVLFLTNSDNGLNLVNVIVDNAVSGIHPALGFPMLHPSE